MKFMSFPNKSPGSRAGINLVLLITTLISSCVAIPQQPGQTDASTTAQPKQHMPDTRLAQDSALLAILARLQDGEHSTYQGQIVETGRRYTAASGRVCKTFTLHHPDTGTSQ